MFTNYPARQRGLQRKLFSVRGQSSLFAKGAAKTTYREGCSLSIYRFTECLRKINRGQKTQHGVVHSICAIGQFFHEYPKYRLFWIPDPPAQMLAAGEGPAHKPRRRGRNPNFWEGNIGGGLASIFLHAEFACDQSESVEPRNHFPSPHPPYTYGDPRFALDRCLGLLGHPFSPSPRCR